MILPREVPNWDEFYMFLALSIAGKSKDPNTQHGCIIADAQHRPLGMGFNGPPRQFPDDKVNWERTQKLFFIAHAEENAIDHTTHKKDLEGATAYITGKPCSSCARRLIKHGIMRILCGPQQWRSQTKEDWEAVQEMARLSGVSLEEFGGKLSWGKEKVEKLANDYPYLF